MRGSEVLDVRSLLEYKTNLGMKTCLFLAAFAAAVALNISACADLSWPGFGYGERLPEQGYGGVGSAREARRPVLNGGTSGSDYGGPGTVSPPGTGAA